MGKISTERVGPGLWRADASYCDRSGTKRRCRKSGRTEAAARRAVAGEVEERLALDNPTGLVTATSRVGDAVDTYLANRMADACNGIGRANRRSVKIYRSLADNWITPFLGELRVRNLTPGRLDAYSRHDIPPTRYQDVRKVLHAFFKWLVVQGALRDDPVASLQSYQRRDVQKRSKDREVTTQDLMAVLAAIDEWMTRKRPGPRPASVYRDLVLLIAGTACRPGEALALRRGDIVLNFRIAPGTTKPVAHITGTVVYDEELGGQLEAAQDARFDDGVGGQHAEAADGVGALGVCAVAESTADASQLLLEPSVGLGARRPKVSEARVNAGGERGEVA